MSGAGAGAARGLERVAADRRAAFAQQIRCSTGFTWRGVLGFRAALPVARARPEAAVVVVLAPLSERLLALLEGLPAGAVLPRLAEMFAALALECHPKPHMALARAFDALVKRRVIRSVSGSTAAHRGERVVVLLASGRRLATAGAPGWWLDSNGGR